MGVKENVCDNINWIIAAREGGSPTSFAKRVGTYAQKVNNWVHGKNCPDLSTMEVIADEYDLSLDFLIRGDTDKAPSDYTYAAVRLGEDD